MVSTVEGHGFDPQWEWQEISASARSHIYKKHI